MLLDQFHKKFEAWENSLANKLHISEKDFLCEVRKLRIVMIFASFPLVMSMKPWVFVD